MGEKGADFAETAAGGVVGMDVVEVSPPFDHSEITALAAAHVALDLLCVLGSRLK